MARHFSILAKYYYNGYTLEYRDDRWSEVLVSKNVLLFCSGNSLQVLQPSPQAHVAKQFQGLSRELWYALYLFLVSLLFPTRAFLPSLSLPPLPYPAPKTCYQQTAGPHSQ